MRCLSFCKCYFVVCMIIALVLNLNARAQYTANALHKKNWTNYGVGLTTSDYLSYHLLASRTVFGETVSSTTRFSYNQELIEGPNDSIYFRKNRNVELGVLWGNGWAHKNLYMHIAAGMGVNVRMYGDSAQQVLNQFNYKVGMTIGVPAQLELGWNKKEHGFCLLVTGNWNFREPYLGALICYSRRFKLKEK